MENNIDLEKTVDIAIEETKTEMSSEEQQAILEQIIKESKQRTANSFFKKPIKQEVSKNADKKRKAKNKQARKSRRANRKKIK